MNFLVKVIVICGLIAGLAVPALAAEEKSSDKVEKTAAKEEVKPAVAQGPDEKGPELTDRRTFRGEVSGISSSFLAIEVSADAKAAHEMAFTVSKDVKINGKAKILDIKNGDTVSILAEETTQSVKTKDKNGKESKETKVLSRVVTEITLVKAAPQPEPEIKPADQADPTSETETESVTEDTSSQESDAGEQGEKNKK